MFSISTFSNLAFQSVPGRLRNKDPLLLQNNLILTFIRDNLVNRTNTCRHLFKFKELLNETSFSSKDDDYYDCAYYDKVLQNVFQLNVQVAKMIHIQGYFYVEIYFPIMMVEQINFCPIRCHFCSIKCFANTVPSDQSSYLSVNVILSE